MAGEPGLRTLLWLAAGTLQRARDGAGKRTALFRGYAHACSRGNDCRGGTRLENTDRGLALVRSLADAGSAARGTYGEHDPLRQLQRDPLGQASALTDHRCGRLVGVVDCGLFGDRVAADRRRLHGSGPHDTCCAPCSSSFSLAPCLIDAAT